MAADRTSLKGRSSLIIASCVAVLAVVAGGLYFTGTYDDWQEERALSRACAGAVPQEELKEFLGVTGRLTSDQAWEATTRDDRRCVIYAPDETGHNSLASLKVTVGQGRSSEQLLTDLGRNESYSATSFVSPIGHGWRGVLSNSATTDDRVTVVIPCDAKARDDLVVNLQAMPRKSTSGSREQRARFARIATQTSAKAAEQAGCKPPSGRPVTRVPDAPSEGATPAGKATGTCAGINAPARETTADPHAPIEDCLVLDKDGDASFRLAAYYGPFVQNGRADLAIRGDEFTGPAGGTDGLYWTTTACPKEGGPAFYTAETLRASEGFTKPSPAVERSALAHFAERSARAHGCAAGKAGQ
ncbi:hypothetical protein ACWHA1_36985 [Streptomyces decoyicus]